VEFQDLIIGGLFTFLVIEQVLQLRDLLGLEVGIPFKIGYTDLGLLDPVLGLAESPTNQPAEFRDLVPGGFRTVLVFDHVHQVLDHRALGKDQGLELIELRRLLEHEAVVRFLAGAEFVEIVPEGFERGGFGGYGVLGFGVEVVRIAVFEPGLAGIGGFGSGFEPPGVVLGDKAEGMAEESDISIISFVLERIYFGVRVVVKIAIRYWARIC
jgi:hypothetical protein